MATYGDVLEVYFPGIDNASIHQLLRRNDHVRGYYLTEIQQSGAQNAVRGEIIIVKDTQ